MSRFPKTLLPRILAMLGAAASMVLAIGAGDTPDDPRVRLQSMSVQRRTELAEALKYFELQLNPDQQKSIRDLDRRLNQLPVEDRARLRGRYEAVSQLAGLAARQGA